MITTQRAHEIIAEEEMGYEALGPVASLALRHNDSDGWDLADDDVSEPANLDTEDSFRAQVVAWREAVQ